MATNVNNTKINFEITSSTNQKLDNFNDYFDPEIFEFVIILNNLGFRTFGSCQGHPGTLGFYPSVLFCNKEVDNLYSEGNLDKITEEFIYKEYSSIIKQEERLLDYLNEFYINRNTLMRNRLVLQTTNFCRFSIEPLFSIMYKTVTDEKEQTVLNKIYLKEIHDFTKFLQSKI